MSSHLNEEKVCLVLIRSPTYSVDNTIAERSSLLIHQVVLPAASETGFRCHFRDPTEYGTSDDEELFKLLERAEVLIVDASIKSTSYAYSLGVRHALTDKPTFLLIEQDKRPFDIIIPRGACYISTGIPSSNELEEARRWLTDQLRSAAKVQSSYSPVRGALESAPRVFLSYAHADRNSVAAVDQWLRDRGARVDLDDRELIAGRDIRDELVRLIQRAGKVVCFYSGESSDRYYTKLERRLSEGVELTSHADGSKRTVLIYFRIDETPLPIESEHRLAINAWKLSFEDACLELWRHILERPAEPGRISLAAFRMGSPPWAKPHS
jgi:TIR domain